MSKVQSGGGGRLGLWILAPHVVQYHAPLYRAAARDGAVDLTVLYCAEYGFRPIYDPTMNTTIQWDVPLLEGYAFRWLRNLPLSRGGAFLSRVNPGIVWRLLTKRCDVLLIQDYGSLTSWLALIAAKLTRTRVVFRGEGGPSDQKLDRRSIKGCLKLWFIRQMDAVLFSCHGVRDWLVLLGAHESKMHFVPCAVDNEFFDRELLRIRASGLSPKGRLGLRENTTYVISTARMHPNKRLQDIVAAVHALQQEGVDVGMILCGDGPERPVIEKTVRDLKVSQVILPGFVNMSRIGEYYAAAGVFALASEADRSPKALSEALVFSLPVVCTETIGTAGELAIPGVNGYLFGVGDVESLTGYLRELVASPERRRAMGMESRRLSLEWSNRVAGRCLVDAALFVAGQPRRIQEDLLLAAQTRQSQR